VKIAIVGSGISGMGAALALSEKHDVTLFEKDSRFGGHANTQRVEMSGQEIAVDTGFIVYNYHNYPNLTGLFAELGVPTKWSDMSFGFSLNDGAMEYATNGASKLFAQRRNMFSLPYLRMLSDIRRFNMIAPLQMDNGDLEGLSLDDWVKRCGFWSSPAAEIGSFPALNFVSFFRNHDLMTGLEPAQRWRTVDGGSREYVSRLIARLGPRAVSHAEVVEVERAARPTLVMDDGSRAEFDQVILATHAPVSLKLLAQKSDDEGEILGAFRTSQNTAYLHSDPSLMPRRSHVWSSWNFMTNGDASRPAPVTYWMNRLQSLTSPEPLLVTLNPATEPNPAKVHGVFNYAHPLYDDAAFRAQDSMDRLQGRGGVWYAGAWLGYGFHEDGLRAGLRVANALGADPSWSSNIGAPINGGFAAAAE